MVTDVDDEGWQDCEEQDNATGNGQVECCAFGEAVGVEANAEKVDPEPCEQDHDIDQGEHGGDTELLELLTPFAVEDDQ